MTREAIYKELNAKNDIYIYNVTKNNFLKTPVYKEVAQQIYDERNMDSPIKQAVLTNLPKYRQAVRLMIKKNHEKPEIIDALISRDVPLSYAEELVAEQFERAAKEEEIKKKPTEFPAKLVVYIVVGIILILIKLFIKTGLFSQ
jgi:hypothetical protein